MKKITKILSVILVLVVATTLLASCSSKYSALKSAFEAKGFEENTTFTGIVNTIKEELNKEENQIKSDNTMVHRSKDMDNLRLELEDEGEDEDLEIIEIDEDDIEEMEDFEYEEDWDEPIKE